MANVNKGGIIAKTQEKNSPAAHAKQTVATLLNSMLDSEGYKNRFNELLGARTPQFVGSVVSLVNADASLQKAFQQAPITIIQSALKAATYDLPIDPALGYAYLVPFNNSIKDGNSFIKRMEASFILGYKGMLQLAMRTGAYKKINVIDVREGELARYNRLTEDIEINFIEDEEVRSEQPIKGWCGYFQLVNGMEKTIYMSKSAIIAHEKKNRKGQNMGKGWRDDFDGMASKTVLRRLIGKWGLMSIDYQKANASTIAAAEAIAKGQIDDEDIQTIEVTTTHGITQNVDTETGEILSLEGKQEHAPADELFQSADEKIADTEHTEENQTEYSGKRPDESVLEYDRRMRSRIK
jgi:recombinase, phage RecT family